MFIPCPVIIDPVSYTHLDVYKRQHPSSIHADTFFHAGDNQRIMESLGSPAYRAKVGTNGNFILMHSVGSIPHGQEIDVPLNLSLIHI